MAAAAIRAHINRLIANMFTTGMLDNNFLQLQRMRDQGRVTPGHVVEVLTSFNYYAHKIINDISDLMKKPEVDFDMVDSLVDELKAKSSSVGAKRLNLFCVQQFCPEAKTKEGYLNALLLVRYQFYDLRAMFQIMIELEQHIAACSPK